MKPKQLIDAVLNRQPVDRIPVDIWLTPEMLESFKDHTGADEELDVYRRLGIDKIVWFPPEYKGELRPVEREDQVAHFWGTLFKKFQAQKAEYIELDEHPLLNYPTVDSLDDYPWWPDPEQFDIDAMAAIVESCGDEFVSMGPWVSFFEIYCQLRGLEQSLMDILIAPDYVNAVLDRLEETQTIMIRRLLERVGDKLGMVMISDDMGNQKGLMISPDSYRQYFHPRMKRWCNLIHSFGVKAFFHSDGGCEPLIPLLIEEGIDVLNPIQHVCPGMAMKKLKAKYGDRLIFHGGVENQKILPFGTPDEVRRETRDCLESLGPDGYICCSCHYVQAGTPVENVLAMIETVHEFKLPE